MKFMILLSASIISWILEFRDVGLINTLLINAAIFILLLLWYSISSDARANTLLTKQRLRSCADQNSPRINMQNDDETDDVIEEKRKRIPWQESRGYHASKSDK
jgi:hypothetical protein